MLASSNDLRTLSIGESGERMTDVEQVHAFFQEKSRDGQSAVQAARRLQSRLELLRKKAPILGHVDVSEHVMAILENA